MQTITQHTTTLQKPGVNSADYHFITTWKINAGRSEVYDILEDVDSLHKWWPAVYLDVKVREKGQPGGIGKIVELYTKGWLPYTLRWVFTVTGARRPEGFTLRATGDFVGEGIWKFEQEGEYCVATYDWKISAEKPFLKKLTFLLRSVFAANHEWAMQKGYESLGLELQRRRGIPDVLPPARPTFPHNILNNNILR